MPPEEMPEVTLLDALIKIKGLKAELLHVKQEQQRQLDALTEQLTRLEAHHLQDRRRLLASARSREALILSEVDPETHVKMDAYDNLKRDHDAHNNTLQRSHREEVRVYEARLAELSTSCDSLNAKVEFFKQRAALEEDEASLLRAALDSKREVDRRDEPNQAFEFAIFLLCQVRDACGSGVVDAVIMRTLKASSFVKDLTIDVLSLLADHLPGFDVHRAEVRLAVREGDHGFDSPGDCGDDNRPNIASPEANMTRLSNGRKLVEQAMYLQQKAEELRRSRSNESACWDGLSKTPIREKTRGGLRSPHSPGPALPLPRTPVQQRRGRGRDAERDRPWAQNWARYWSSWKDGHGPHGGGGGGGGGGGAAALHTERSRSANVFSPPASRKRRTSSAPHRTPQGGGGGAHRRSYNVAPPPRPSWPL